MLQRMSQGGIYDHLGGGYARYSTDAVWLVPHFEKMLYDNAQLLELLALAHAHRPDPLYAARAAETVGWMMRDMTAERVDGRAAFAASEDADSEGEEGRFYVWTEAEVDALLGADAPRLQARLRRDARAATGKATPSCAGSPRPATPEQEAALARVPRRSCSPRARSGCGRGATTRCWPTGTAWPIAALARAAAVFDRPEWLARAGEAFDFVLREHGRRRMAGCSTPGGSAASPPRGCWTTRRRWRAPRWRCSRRPASRRGWPQAIRLARRRRDVRSPTGRAGYYTTAADATDVPLARPRTAGGQRHAGRQRADGGGASRGCGT